MRTTYILFFLVLSASVQAQQNHLNRLDAGNNEHGTWMVYWDNNWNHTDSTKATYCWYTHYDHGQNLRPMAGRDRHWKMVPSDSTSHAGNGPVLLDGEYKWYDETGVLRSVDVFKKGEYVSYKCYHPNGKLIQWFDYTKNWEGQPHSWYITEYDDRGHLQREGYFKRDRKKQWPVTN